MVRFRWSRAAPDGVKSYRITRDRAGRWHVGFAATPEPIAPPATGSAIGVDRGVVVSAALSTGELLNVPALRRTVKARLLRLQRKLARAQRGSNRRDKVRTAIARLKARETDRRKDRVEKTSTRLAREFEVIAVEDLKIANMTRSAKGTRDTPGRMVKIDPRYTSHCNADVNAALNIRNAAGHAVTAWGGPPLGEPVNRVPQRDLLFVG